jgi:hypothetical protein
MKATINHDSRTVSYNDGSVGIQQLRNAFQALLDVKVSCAVYNPEGLAWCLNPDRTAPRRVALPVFGMMVDGLGSPMEDGLTELFLFEVVSSHLPQGWGLVLLEGGPSVRKTDKGIQAFRKGDWRPY